MKVLTVGGATIDTIAIIADDRIERMTMLNADSSFLLLEEGRKTEAREISTHVGGGAVNAAVAMARLGLDVSTLVKLGKDQRAETVLAASAAGGRLHPLGAARRQGPHGRLRAGVVARPQRGHLHLPRRQHPARGGGPAPGGVRRRRRVRVLAQQRIRRCLSRHRPHGEGERRARLQPTRACASSPRAAPVFQEALAQIDILAINRVEAETLVPGLVARFGEGGGTLPLEPGEKPPRLLARGFLGGGHEMSLAAFFDALRQMGPRFVLVTDGRHGAFLGTKDAIHFCPVRETKVAGTAGAGDAFNATFTAYIALGRRPEDALRAAAINAASVVGHVDTQTGLLAREAIAEALRGDG